MKLAAVNIFFKNNRAETLFSVHSFGKNICGILRRDIKRMNKIHLTASLQILKYCVVPIIVYLMKFVPPNVGNFKIIFPIGKLVFKRDDFPLNQIKVWDILRCCSRQSVQQSSEKAQSQ